MRLCAPLLYLFGCSGRVRTKGKGAKKHSNRQFKRLNNFIRVSLFFNQRELKRRVSERVGDGWKREAEREGGRERGTEVRWRRRRRKEVETAFVMVRAKRITGDGEKEGGRERERRDARARFHTSFLHHHASEVAVDARSRSVSLSALFRRH